MSEVIKVFWTKIYVCKIELVQWPLKFQQQAFTYSTAKSKICLTVLSFYFRIINFLGLHAVSISMYLRYQCHVFFWGIFRYWRSSLLILKLKWGLWLHFILMWYVSSSVLTPVFLQHKMWTFLTNLSFFFLLFQGRNADALALYFGEDPARCPFEQGIYRASCCCMLNIRCNVWMLGATSS